MHSTALLTNIIYDLCAYQEYIEPLREEWQTALKAENNIVSKGLTRGLRKMESFIKESQRMYPAQMIGMNRYVDSDLRLSDGTLLPEGSFISVPVYSINYDPDTFEKPDQFDGWRFEKLRAQDQKADAHWQFVTTDPYDNVNFGHGKHACPGRFFASNEVRIASMFWLKT
jgi:ent-kaurene oxidase